MDYPKIDWSDLENVEPVPGGEWDGRKIIAHYQRDSDDFPHLVVVQDADGACEAETITNEGRIWYDSPPVIRNKPKRVTLQECWVVYDSDGQYRITVFSEEAAEWNAGKGRIVKHIPAETIEV